MRWLYTLFVFCYGCSIRLAAWFHPKASRWTRGRRHTWRQLQEACRDTRPTAWFHCASLGEFEQGRPVIEAFRKEYPGHRIILTFFSPSGYEVRKNYPGTDVIVYLPDDLPYKVRRFLDITKPGIVFFVKYEYWFNYLRQLHRRNIPILMVSAIFRGDQYFFRWYGAWFRRQLQQIRHFFVQHESSLTLLAGIGLDRASVSGDTRFDRVSAIAGQPGRFPVMESYRRGQRVILAGSTWPADEAILFPMMRQDQESRFIIAPHEIHEERIEAILKGCGVPAVRFSIAGDTIDPGIRLVVVDTMGQLSGMYRYADIAYIGGGFGKGIHNILEAATFAKPVIFGPRYHKFIEAIDLVQQGGAFTVQSAGELATLLEDWSEHPEKARKAGDIAEGYVRSHTGATRRIMDYCKREGLA